jgi:hypothetical protein
MAVVAAMFMITLTLQAPVVVFFEAYRLYFFAGRYPRLEALLWPAQPAPPTPEPLRQPPPPLPGIAG